MKRKRKKEILDYDEWDSSAMIDASRPLSFKDIDLKLPDQQPTQVVSIRLPSNLLNEVKAISSQQDIPYQALIKHILSNSVSKLRRKAA